MQPDPGRGDRPGVELTLGADVERPASKGQRDAQPDEDERHRAHHGAGGKGVPGAEGAQPESAEPGRRIEAARFQPGEENRQTQYHRRNRPPQGPHASLSARSIIAPISDRNAPAGASTIMPRATTMIRSARYSTSSRSAE